MFKYAGVTLDHYDDGGETLKRIFPTVESLPDVIKTASIQPPEKLPNEQYALVATDSGHVLRKFAMNDAGTTAMSVIYLLEHGSKLPDPAIKMAANRLVDACGRFGILAPRQLLKMAGVEQLSPLQQALQMHEAQETPEQEALEQATGMEANPDAIVGEGPAGFMPDANINPELLAAAQMQQQQQLMPEQFPLEQAFGDEVRPVDLTGQAPAPKLASPRPRADEDYAVVLSDGRRLYPIDSWDNVKLAHQYFEENERRMDPAVRHQFAERLATKAASIGYLLPGSIQEAGATTYADEGHLKAALEMRKVAFRRGSAEHEFLDELFEKRAAIEPATYAECIRRFDVMNGIDRAWDTGFLDPWSSTFGLEKKANKVVWEDGAERVTEGELQNLSTNGSIPLQTVFTPIFAAEFQKDPVSVFESMPLAQKRVLARMAVDVGSQGGSEGEISRSNILPMRRAG